MHGSRRAVLAGLIGVAGCGGRPVERQVTRAASGPGGEAGAGGGASEPAAAAGFALVELFSSEGCSSCPPADALLDEVRARPGVLTLAFHVDYWDSLGWPDPYASAAFTARQEDYVRGLGLRQLYTPQMVVNGRREFVGSDRSRASAAIDDALGQPASVQITISTPRVMGGRRSVPVLLTGAPSDAEVFLAAVDGPLVSEVKRGENAGRTLHHGSVVRSLVRGAAHPDSVLSVPGASGRLVAWVQRPGGPVLGATSLGG